MKKPLVLMALGGLGLLGGCSGPIGGGIAIGQPLETLAPVSLNHPLIKNNSVPTSALPLVARYYRVEDVEHNKKLVNEAGYWGLTYKPRQSNFKGYEDWDMLQLPPQWYKPDLLRPDWLRIGLNREAKLVVVWEKSEGWLAGWQKSEALVSGKKTYFYSKNFPAGEAMLGSPGKKGDSGPNYVVLLAEKDGTASKEPPLPAGISERPLPNQTCPSWLENAWTLGQVYGPEALIEGQDYKTWHPQIDPIYWCYNAHDHGSDPSLVKYRPAVEFVAKRFFNQPELHVGFKGFAIPDEETGLGWYINLHSETGVQTRACARFHTVVMAITRMSTGEKLVELGYKGDFGASKSNQGDNPTIGATCTDAKGNPVTQAEIAKQTVAEKNIRVFQGDKDPGGYENWRGGLTKALGMSFWGDDGKDTGLSIDIRNPATGCADLSCAGVRSTDSHADMRTLFIGNLKIKYTEQIRALDQADGSLDGYFWTDAYGNALSAELKAGDPGTIRQYMKPGFNSENGNREGLTGGFHTEDAWRGLYLESTELRHVGAPQVELEEGLGSLN
jgi:hypothetical protein